MESGLSWWNMRRKAIAQLNDEIATNNQASDSTCDEECTGNSVVVPCAIPVPDLKPNSTSSSGKSCQMRDNESTSQSSLEFERSDGLPFSDESDAEEQGSTDLLPHNFSVADTSRSSKYSEGFPNEVLVNYDEFNYLTCDVSSSDEDEEILAPRNLRERLSDWAISCNISNASVALLLAALRVEHPDLPKDPRSLRAIPKNIQIDQIAGGQYFHFGLKKGIISKLKLLNQYRHSEFEQLQQLSLQFNVDGLPLYKSVPGEFWPILCKIENISVTDPFAIGIFFGKQKPTDANEYLTQFVSELKEIVAEGLVCCNVKFAFNISCFICDAPARAFLKNTIQHTGYSSCERCTSKGCWAGKVIHTDLQATLRTDSSFRSMDDARHHKGPSPLAVLEMDMIKSFPLDYMHLCCLGVMRRMLYMWFRSSHSCRIPYGLYTSISNHLMSLSSHSPREFARKPRSLKYLERWKATELRQFLLYTGPVVLRQKLDDHHYKHFLVFSTAMRILLSPEFSADKMMVAYAGKLLKFFVENFARFYGNEMLVYNVHSLIHLHHDALCYGALDQVSAFPYENYLGQLKKLLKKPNHPLKQVVHRFIELNSMEHQKVTKQSSSSCYKKHSLGPVDDGNNFVQLQDGVAVVRNIVLFKNVMYCVCNNFGNSVNFFDYPVESSKVGVFLLSDMNSGLSVVPANEIKCKVVAYPEPSALESYISMSFLHTIV